MDIKGKARLDAANFLKDAILDAILDKDPVLTLMARQWLYLDRPPTPEEIFYPHPLGFLVTCDILGLNWYELNKHLKIAADIKEPKLSLVQSSELMYNNEHETTITASYSDRTRQAQECLSQLYR